MSQQATDANRTTDQKLDQIYEEYCAVISPAVRLVTASLLARCEHEEDAQVTAFIQECYDRFLPRDKRMMD